MKNTLAFPLAFAISTGLVAWAKSPSPPGRRFSGAVVASASATLETQHIHKSSYSYPPPCERATALRFPYKALSPEVRATVLKIYGHRPISYMRCKQN